MRGRCLSRRRFRRGARGHHAGTRARGGTGDPGTGTGGSARRLSGDLRLDADGVILAHLDRAQTRRIIAAAADHLIVNGWLARRLPAVLAEAGLEAIGVRAFTPVERDPAGFAAKMAERRAAIARQAGAITEDEQQCWLAALHAEQTAGRFLGARPTCSSGARARNSGARMGLPQHIGPSACPIRRSEIVT
jgi:hypothetical protein